LEFLIILISLLFYLKHIQKGGVESHVEKQTFKLNKK
jgi:hypothetical protein